MCVDYSLGLMSFCLLVLSGVALPLEVLVVNSDCRALLAFGEQGAGMLVPCNTPGDPP